MKQLFPPASSSLPLPFTAKFRATAALLALLWTGSAGTPVPLGAATIETSQTPSAPHRFAGDAKIAYSDSAIHPEVGDSSRNQVAIKVDVTFGRPHGLPSGIVYVDFQGADILLMASQLDWLVVSQKQIELKGSCFLDDSDGFTFQMKIERNLKEGKPRVRIKVWETDRPDHVVFDNQRDDKWSAPVSSSSEVLSGELSVS